MQFFSTLCIDWTEPHSKIHQSLCLHFYLSLSLSLSVCLSLYTHTHTQIDITNLSINCQIDSKAYKKKIKTNWQSNTILKRPNLEGAPYLISRLNTKLQLSRQHSMSEKIQRMLEQKKVSRYRPTEIQSTDFNKEAMAFHWRRDVISRSGVGNSGLKYV